MKVLHLSYSDFKGGASRAVLRIHNALLKNNVNSNLQVNLSNSYKNKNNIIGPKNFFYKFINLLRAAIGTRLGLLLRTDDFVLHSLAILPSYFYKTINKSDFDIINLHWVGGEMLSIEDIGKIKKPIVWTLHDMWSFCGAEHFTLDNERWTKGYFKSNRPNTEKFFDIKKFVWNRKIKNWKKKMNIVGVSSWMANCASSSYLMKNWPVKVIHNTLDVNFWKPTDKKNARNFFKLPEGYKVIGYGSLGYKNSSLKGKDLLLSAIPHIKYDKKKTIIALLGEGNDFIKEISGIKVFNLGKLDKDEDIRNFYNALDLIIIPSRLESFGQTASEASSCGIPSVCFDTTGLKDIVEHKKNGWLAEKFNVTELAKGIDFFLKMNNQDYIDTCNNARLVAVKKFSYEKIAKEYIDLYKKILNQDIKSNN